MEWRRCWPATSAAARVCPGALCPPLCGLGPKHLAGPSQNVTRLSCWHWHKSLSGGAQGMWCWEDASAEAWWPEKVSGCFGEDVEEPLYEWGAGNTTLKFCWEVLVFQCCVGVNGHVIARSGKASGWKGRKHKPVLWCCHAVLWKDHW